MPELEAQIDRLEGELSLALVERDPADEKDVIVEIRQGVGGDEAALWAGDVRRMLTRYAERIGLKTEMLSTSESEGGGVKEAVFAVKGRARSRSSSSRAERTACSAFPRPSRRGGSTPRPRRWR